MKKPYLRKIIIGEETYLWKFDPGYEKIGEQLWRGQPIPQYRRHDIFTAYAEHDKNFPLKVHFFTWECAISGGPLHNGAPINLDNPDTGGINLHRPKFAAEIIQHAVRHGWNPAEKKPLIIDDGIGLLAELGYQVE